MYADLKDISTNEERWKVEILENKGRRQELESLNADLQERFGNQELKVRSLQNEIERLRREQNSKSDVLEQSMIEMRDENKYLRERLQ